MSTTPTLPRVVREVYEELHHECRQEPTVEFAGPGRIRLGVANERVRMTVDYTVRGIHGRWRWDSSRLWIDGQERPIAKSPAEFYAIFHDPSTVTVVDGRLVVDSGEAETAEVRTEPDPMPPAADPDRAPKEVRTVYRMFTDRLGDKLTEKGGVIELGNAGKLWVVGFSTPDGVVLRMNFRKRKGGVCSLDRRRPIEVWIEGQDFTAEVGGDLEKAMGLIAGPRTAPGTGPKIGHPAPAAVNTGVRVRKQTVMRI